MKREAIEKNPLLKTTFYFSLHLIEYCEELEVNRKYVVAKQLLRSGTSIGANSIEAQGAESKADFNHKIKIAAKEAEETQYWLWLCKESKNYPNCDMLLEKLEEINKIIGTIVNTIRQQKIAKII